MATRGPILPISDDPQPAALSHLMEPEPGASMLLEPCPSLPSWMSKSYLEACQSHLIVSVNVKKLPIAQISIWTLRNFLSQNEDSHKDYSSPGLSLHAVLRCERVVY